jgi:Tfp pilus assembly protein PilX
MKIPREVTAMRKTDRKAEGGFSLIVALLALMLLSAVAIGMMFMASTETAISSNFKSEEAAYFAARAGVEEARDRMRASSANPIALPAALPPAASSVLYITQTGVTQADITDASKKTFDDEICHDFPTQYGSTTLNVPCTSSQGPNAAWITTTPSVAPYPLEYKWVRVTQKQSNSSPYPVVPGSAAASYLACWNGTNEVATGATCPAENLPVYLVTALAVSQSGARRLVQQEIALTETSSTLPGGMFATSKNCPALTLKGGALTGSFNSAAENPPKVPPVVSPSGGDVGTNGGALIGGGNGSTDVQGQVSTGEVSVGVGVCPGNGVVEQGNPKTGPIVQNPIYTPPTPPAPNPPPPTTAYPAKNKSIPNPWPPGSYGDVTISGTVNLVGGADINHPTVYTLNSVTEVSANAQINVNGPVVINLAGVTDANLKGNPPTVLNLTGNGFANSSGLPGNLVINYGGTDQMSFNGNSTFYGTINAPNSAMSLNGGMTFYGQLIGSTIDDNGGAAFYWDTSLKTTITTTQPYFSEISLRELSY